jgi:hypothetical protein
MRHKGIVLKSWHTTKCKLALLDMRYGRIDASSYKSIHSPGLLLSYTLESVRGRLMISDVMIENSPLYLAQEDILFLHHVLELCSTLIPIGSCTQGIFALLLTLYESHHQLQARQHKKLFIFKLLALLGIASCHYHMRVLTLHQLHTISIDTSMKESLHLESEKDLDNWLQHTIAEYTNIDQLQTIHFLHKSREA